MPRLPLPLPVLGQPAPLVECTECALCCTYVAVGINDPSTPRLATDVLWYLYHERVYVYVDEDGEWSVVFETRCRQLGDDRRCGIYPSRPHICRGFDNKSCEVNAPASGDLSFREPAQFLAWLRRKRPRLHARVERGFVPEQLRSQPRPAAPRRRKTKSRNARS